MAGGQTKMSALPCSGGIIIKLIIQSTNDEKKLSGKLFQIKKYDMQYYLSRYSNNYDKILWTFISTNIEK